MIEKQFLTVDEVAQMTGFTSSTIRALLNARELRGARVNRTWRVATRDLEQFMESRMNMATTAV